MDIGEPIKVIEIEIELMPEAPVEPVEIPSPVKVPDRDRELVPA